MSCSCNTMLTLVVRMKLPSQMDNLFIELVSIDFPWPAVDFRQRSAMKALPLLQHFQSNFVRIFDRFFHIPVIHLQCDWKQCACEMIKNRDRIFSFHDTILPTGSHQATDRAVKPIVSLRANRELENFMASSFPLATPTKLWCSDKRRRTNEDENDSDGEFVTPDLARPPSDV